MSDPSTAAACAVGAACAAPTILLGADVNALLIGMFAAFFVTLWLDQIADKLRAGGAVALSTLLAGYVSPVAASWVSQQVPSVSTNLEALHYALAVVIGAAGPTMVPVLLRRVAKEAEEKQ